MSQQFDIVGNLLLKVDGAEAGLNKLKNSLSQLKIPANLDSNLKKSFSNLDGLFAKYKAQLKDGFNTKGDVTSFAKTGKQIEAEYDRIAATVSKLTGKDISFKVDLTTIQNLEKEIERVVTLKEKLSQDIKGGLGLNDYLKAMQASNVGRRGTKVFDASNMLQTSLGRGDIEKAKTDVEGLISELNRMSDARKKALEDRTGIAFNQIITELRTKVTDADQAMNKFGNDIKTTSDNIAQIRADGVDKVTNALNEAVGGTEKAQSGFKQLNGTAQEAANSMLSMTKQVQDLQQSTQYFFSLRNMINLLKRGIDDAVQSVKELDKAMTDTAVVTDYKVSDLWGMLPEYTKVANELGATTQGAYETMTLYYQQGLDQQQAFELGAETMKMARIAGLDYAETTDMMTAALRGFNMELNETSAKRVNDVYSKLAAVTASDTEELGTAMQRTASIAASAGMSFEGATAFLAQAIETTREPAENIGTAMKTIVARFQEMKKNPLEISEVDGEEVSYNKIDAALKTIGVDLKDTNGQFRQLDQVFLDISQRWDSLSQTQQRYIATVAAGSRQQSRFIAMMSNYDRTMQLMEAANNSAGASDEQFGKTMDSLESKLNQLHNAWQAFTMGIANNGMIKLAVDGLTKFLTVTNKIIDKLSMGSGAIKSFLSVFAAFTGLKAAGRIANRAIGGLGGLIDPQSTFKEGFKGGAIKQGQTGTAQAKAISDPIVTAVNRIYGAITGKQAATNQTTQNTTADFKSFKDANTEMRNFLGGLKTNEKFSITEAYGKIGKLDERQQKAVLQQLPGLQLSLQKNGINFNTADLSDSTSKLIKTFNNEINQGLKDKTIDSQGILQLFGTPENFKRGMEARGPEYVKAAEEVLNKGIDKAKIQDEVLNSKIVERDLLGAKWSDNQILEMAQKEADKKIKTLQENNLKEGIKGTASASMQAANDFAAMGQAATMAGQGIAQLGMQLSNIGFEQAGQAVTNLGYQISSLGTIASNVGSVVGKIIDNGGLFGKAGLMAAHPIITALIVAVGTLGAVFAAASAKVKKIKEAGEEVTKTFNETNKSVEDNIAKLKSYQSEFATLSKGVDSNGNNVSLDDSQYQRYLEIVDDIAAINPEIVEGYNAQGHAIINNNKALAETLKKQQEIRKEAYSTYTSEDSLKALIRARNVNKDYYESVANKTKAKGTFVGGTAGQVATGYTSPMTGDVASIADKLGLIKDFDETVLEKYGIDSLKALESGEEKAVKNFIKHRQQIEAELSSSDLKLDDAILKSFDKLGEDATAFDEAIKPVYDNLLANVSNSKVFESIASEFREAFNMGLKDLASQDLNANEMAKAANNMALKFANLSSEGSDYAEALDVVEKAQQDFATTLNETEYRADVQPAIDDLTRLKETALKEGGAYGDALAEYLENQIQHIARFTEEGSVSLTEALNTATDEIAAAESALENFNEATKTDYSTAAEGMKSIFDKSIETFKDSYGTEIQKHFEGKGDKTAWAAADALLDQESIDKIYKKAGGDGYKAAEMAAKKIQSLEPMLREGQEGFEAFEDRVLASQDALKAIDGVTWDSDGLLTNIPDDKWHAVAEALDISDDMLTSMLNKGRQFADINFTNWDDVRKSLATSDFTIKGTTATEGAQKLYVKESTFEQSLADANISRDQYKQYKDTAKKEQNIDFLKPAEEYKKGSEVLAKKFNDMGVKTLPDLVNTLVKTGDFNKEEIKAYADKLNLLDTETGYNEIYDSVLSALDNPEIAKQTNIQQGISDKLSLLLGNDIQAGKEAEQDLNDYINSDAIQNFAEGKNEAGETISAGEYEATKQNIEEASRAAREHAEEERRLADLTYGQEKANHLKLAESLEKDAEKLDELGKSGVNAFKDIAEQQRINAREKQALKSKNKNREINPPKQYQEPSNVRTLQKEAKIEKTVEPIKTGAETGKKIVETVIKTKEDSSVAKTDKKYDKWGKPIETSIDVSVGGKEQIEAVDSGMKEVAQIAKKSLKLSIDADSQPVEEAQDSITDAQKGASDGADFKVTADYSQAVAAGNYLGAAAKTYTATFRASSSGLSTVSSVLSSILGKIRSINTTSVSPKGGQGASGHNNQIHYHSSPTFGSAARGRHGTVGPKDKGGLTLTGEKGFEIAWIPSENSSMILGVGGPQMLNLPPDAVIYTHEQSKKILSRKGIPAGSHADEGAKPGSTKRKYDQASQQESSSSSDLKSKPKPKPKPKPNDDKEQKATKQIALWWDKISRQVEGAKKKSDNLSKTITKTLNDIRASVDLVNKSTGENAKFIKTQQKNIKLNSSIEKKSASKLNKLDKSKKGSKKKITYKDSKGKEHKSKVSLSDYISYDATTDSYYVNSKVNSKKAGSKAKRKAIKEKAYELIDKYQGRRDDAREAITESQDQLSEYRKQIDDTFFGWENELTKVYKITSEIERTEALISKSRSKYGLAQTQLEGLDLSRGATGAKDLQGILGTMKAANKEAIQGYSDEIKQKSALVDSLKEEVSKYDELDNAHTVMYQTIDGTVEQTTELARYAMIKGIASNGSGTGWDELSENDKKIYTRGRAFEAGYISKDNQGNWTLNETAIANAIAAGQMTGDFGERLKTLFDSLKQNTIDIINAESEIYSLQQEQLETEQEYNDQMKQIADQLYGWKNTLTKILELTTKIEQVEKRTSLLKQGEEYYTAKRKAGYGVNSATILQTYGGQLASSITAIQKRQELIEKQRENLKDYISGNDISKELARASAEFERDPNNDVLKAELQNLKEEAQYRKDAQKYITTTANGDGTFTIEFDSDQLELDKIANGGSVGTEYYNKIEEYAQELISKNNELAENLAASVSSVTELYTMLSDLRQTYADSAKELREAYNTQQQKVINNLKTLYTAIDNAFKDLISQVKQSIQQRRQAEDNAKTEQDINKKQQRLAALRANTAGGNQVAIAQLEKEIADAQQSYGRTLEDQMLNTLSQQGDEAAKQRQEQINLLQAQRDIAYKTGLDAAQINQWLHNPMLHKNEIKAALQGADAWASLTEAERKVYDDALNAKFAGYEELPNKISLTEQAINLASGSFVATEQTISNATLSAISTATQTIQKGLTDGLEAMGADLGIDLANTKKSISDINTETNKAISDLQTQINTVNQQIKNIEAAQAAEVARKAAEEAARKAAEEAARKAAEEEARKAAEEAARKAAEEEEARKAAEAVRKAAEILQYRNQYNNAKNQKNISWVGNGSDADKYFSWLLTRGNQYDTGDKNWGKIGGTGFKNMIALGGKLGYSEKQVVTDLANTKALTWPEILKAAKQAGYTKDQVKNWGSNQYFTAALANWDKYKTGGLADYTGPAWLDGTPSKPELVLNAKDTQNFLALRDVLSKALGSTNSVSNSYAGDVMYEININVDKIEKDYDVDRVVEKVKKEIVKGAGYRNVTQVRNFK